MELQLDSSSLGSGNLSYTAEHGEEDQVGYGSMAGTKVSFMFSGPGELDVNISEDFSSDSADFETDISLVGFMDSAEFGSFWPGAIFLCCLSADESNLDISFMGESITDAGEFDELEESI